VRFLLQKVTDGSVTWGDEPASIIGIGLVVLVGIGAGDQLPDIAYLVQKTLSLRIFRDPVDNREVSIQDVQGELLVVSQFTLYADTSKGRRPSFVNAASTSFAEELFGEVLNKFEASNLVVRTGQFGAQMILKLSNDGPYTIMMDSVTAHR
jgi:D-tyrosyl-tRNA(Tyr) deacylase